DFLNHPLANVWPRHLRQLERIGLDDVLLLDFALAVPEQPCLRIMIAEGGAAPAHFGRVKLLVDGFEPTSLGPWRRLGRPAIIDGIRLIRGLAGVDGLAGLSFGLGVGIRAHWT